MTESKESTTTGDVLTLLVFLLLGAPMAYFVWHALSDLFRGVVDPVALGIALPVLIVFVFLARVLGARIQRMAGSGDAR